SCAMAAAAIRRTEMRNVNLLSFMIRFFLFHAKAQSKTAKAQRRITNAFASFAVSLRLCVNFLFHPISDEHVRLARRLRIPVRREHELLPIWREHRETI